MMPAAPGRNSSSSRSPPRSELMLFIEYPARPASGIGILLTHTRQPGGMTVSPLLNVREHPDTKMKYLRTREGEPPQNLVPPRSGTSDGDRILHTTSSVTIRALNRYLQGCYGCSSATPQTRCEDTTLTPAPATRPAAQRSQIRCSSTPAIPDANASTSVRQRKAMNDR